MALGLDYAAKKTTPPISMSRTFFRPIHLLTVAIVVALGGLAGAAPPAPAHLALTAAPLAGPVGLTWNVATGATSYSVKRATAASGPFSAVGSPATTTFTDATAAAGTRYFYRVTAVDGTGEGAASLTISTTPASVVDNTDASGVTLTGAWSVSTGVAGFYGTNYLLDGNTGATGGKSVRFTPTIAFSGRYDVYLRWTADPNRASNARVNMNSTAGTTFLRVNQQTNGGAWVKLGAFDFAAGTSGNVLLRNDGANGWVVADAVQFVLNEQPHAGYTQTTFVDEFDGTAYDPAVWSVYDSRPNNFVSSGQLHLTTTANGTDWVEGGLYTSQFMQRFGYYETVMQVGRDDGLNNAFWLYTPFSHGNNVDTLEIDITEAHFHDHNHMNVHDWRPLHVASGTTQTVTDIYPGYHTVGLEWATDGTLRWYWDGSLARTMAASQLAGYESMTPMQVMFSTKVIAFAGTPGPLLDGSSMDIANVRVWMKPGWTGALDGNWGTVSNWGPDGVPGAGDAAVFNGATARTTVSLASDKSVKELYFTTPGCPALTLAAGSFKFLLGALASGSGVGGIVVNGDVTTAQTINTAIQAQNDLTFANYSTAPAASLNVNGALTSSATDRQLTLGGNGRVILGGSISAQFGNVVKVNAGAAWLTNANAFTGTADIQDGRLVVTDSGALGATGGITTVASGATLALAGGVNFTNAETVHLAGKGETGASGSLDVEDNSSVSFSGLLVMDAAARIGSGAGTGTLTLGSDLDTTAGAFALSFAGSGTTIMNGAITGAGALTKTGTGTLRLNGIASHTGATTVSQGTLITNLTALPGVVVNNATVIFDDASDRTVTNNWGGNGTYIKQGAGTVAFSGIMSAAGILELQAGTARLGDNERFSSTLDLIVNTGAVFDLNAFTETLGPVVLAGGSIVNSTGSSSQYLAGTSYDVRSGTVSARLGGTGALTKTTGGTVTLSGANTFTGGTTVQAGALDLAGSLGSNVTVEAGALALGATAGVRTVNGSVTVNASGTLRVRINGTTAGTQYDQLRLTNAASNVTLAGTLDLVAAPGLAAGGTFRIIDNSGSANAVTGTFAGLPEGAEFYEDSQWWRINYTGGTGNDVLLTRLTPTPTQTWQSTNFGANANNPLIAGDLADPDVDGISNLLERATAMNPNLNDNVPQSATRNGSALDFIYTKNKSATDLNYIVEWSDTLLNDWSTMGVSAPTILSDNGVTQQVKVTVPAGAGITKRFVHLNVTRL
jgi:autotransporter-associated beta strand protein